MGMFSKFGFHKDQKTKNKKEGGKVSTHKKRKRKHRHRRRSKIKIGGSGAKSLNNQNQRKSIQEQSQLLQTVYMTRQRSQSIGFSSTSREKNQNSYVLHRKQPEMPNSTPSNEKMTFAEYLTGIRKKPVKVESKESTFPPGLIPAGFTKIGTRSVTPTPKNEIQSKSNVGKEQLGTKPSTPKKEIEKVKEKPGQQSLASKKSDKLSEIQRIKSFITFFLQYESEMDPMFDVLKCFIPKSFSRQIFDENVEKCRYADIICMDQTRVVLENCASGNFIHANYVQINKEVEKNKIIVAQFPTESTIFDFWHMIWQESISTVVSIMTESEMKGFCDPIGLLPEVGHCRHIADGFTVTFQKMVSGSSKDFKVYVYGLIHKNDYRQMCWIQYHGWPENRAPLKTDGILQILSLTKRSKKPFVVMSLAGAGRAGTFAAIEIAHYFLHLGKTKKFDVFEMITQVREGRFHSIQTLSQFKFIFLVLIDHFLASKKVKEEIDDDIQEKYKNIREMVCKNFENDKSQSQKG